MYGDPGALSFSDAVGVFWLNQGHSEKLPIRIVGELFRTTIEGGAIFAAVVAVVSLFYTRCGIRKKCSCFFFCAVKPEPEERSLSQSERD